MSSRPTTGYVMKSESGHYYTGFRRHNGQRVVSNQQAHAIKWRGETTILLRDLAAVLGMKLVRLVAPVAVKESATSG